MKKQLIQAIFISCLLGGSLELSAYTLTNPSSQTLTPEQEQNFYALLRAGVAKSEERVQGLVLQMANDRNMITDKNQIMVSAAKNTMEVKATLYSNFVGTPSIQNADVRALLLKIFNKEIVNMDDLMALKTLVASVKQQQALQRQQAPTPSTVNP